MRGDWGEGGKSLAGRVWHKLLGNFSATFKIFGNFLDFRQLLRFSATLDFFNQKDVYFLLFGCIY